MPAAEDLAAAGRPYPAPPRVMFAASPGNHRISGKPDRDRLCRTEKLLDLICLPGLLCPQIHLSGRFPISSLGEERRRRFSPEEREEAESGRGSLPYVRTRARARRELIRKNGGRLCCACWRRSAGRGPGIGRRRGAGPGPGPASLFFHFISGVEVLFVFEHLGRAPPSFHDVNSKFNTPYIIRLKKKTLTQKFFF